VSVDHTGGRKEEGGSEEKVQGGVEAV